MTATAHALVAGAIATKFPDPTTAAALALTSHFIMDSVPHWDIGTNWRSRSKTATGTFAIIETLTGITIAYALFAGKVELFLLTITLIASLIPDWLEAPWYIWFANHKKTGPRARAGILERCCFAIYKKQNLLHAKAQFPFGLITQFATVAFFLVLLK